MRRLLGSDGGPWLSALLRLARCLLQLVQANCQIRFQYNLQFGSIENGMEDCLNPLQVAFPLLSGSGIESLPVEPDKKDNSTSFARAAPDFIHDRISVCQ